MPYVDVEMLLAYFINYSIEVHKKIIYVNFLFPLYLLYVSPLLLSLFSRLIFYFTIQNLTWLSPSLTLISTHPSFSVTQMREIQMAHIKLAQS